MLGTQRTHPRSPPSPQLQSSELADIMLTRNRTRSMDANNVKTDEEDRLRTTISQFQTGSALLNLAPEIAVRVLTLVGEDDVASLPKVASVCRLLGWYVYQDPDKALWRDLHNHYFDDPRKGMHYESTSPYISTFSKSIDTEKENGRAKNKGKRKAVAMEEKDGEEKEEETDRTVRQEYDWKKSMIDRWIVMKALEGEGDVFEEVLEERMPYLKSIINEIGDTLLSIYNDFSSYDPANTSSSSSHSLNASLLTSLISSKSFLALYRSSFVSPPRQQSNREGGGGGGQPPMHHPIMGINHRQHDDLKLPNQKLAQLHCLLGWFSSSSEQKAYSLGIPSAARSHFSSLGQYKKITYNIRNYSHSNDFGPFNPDGTVNWSIVDAIAQTMDANITFVSGKSPFRGKPNSRHAYRDWGYAKPPVEEGIEGVRGKGWKGLEKDSAGDWAGVDGTWRGSYAFMDYTDWMEYNFNSAPFLRRRTDPIEMDSYVEAVGDYMSMTITTELTEFTKSLPALSFNLPISEKFPPIYYNGVSSNRSAGAGGSHGGAHLRGRVALTMDDPPQVRWTWVVRYDGEDRWRIEAVQIGGRGSKRGLVGVWSDVERADLSPIGPVCYWHVPQSELEEEEESRKQAAASTPMEQDNAEAETEDSEEDEDFEADSEALSEETDGELVPEEDGGVTFL